MGFVYASFPGRKQATRAVSALVNHSFDPERIQVIARLSGQVHRIPVRRKHYLVRGTIMGSLLGALGGVGLGALLSEELSPGLQWLFYAGGGLAVGLLCGVRATLHRFAMEPHFPRTVGNGHDVVVGVFANAKRARAARAALRSADAPQTFVAHGQPRLVGAPRPAMEQDTSTHMAPSA